MSPSDESPPSVAGPGESPGDGQHVASGPAGFDPGIMTDGSDNGGGDGAEVDPTSESSDAGQSGQDAGSMPESGDNAFGGDTGV